MTPVITLNALKSLTIFSRHKTCGSAPGDSAWLPRWPPGRLLFAFPPFDPFLLFTSVIFTESVMKTLWVSQERKTRQI